MANRVSFYKYLLIAFLMASPLGCKAKVKAPNVAFRDSVLNLVFTYAKRTDTTGLHGSQSYSYTKMQAMPIVRMFPMSFTSGTQQRRRSLKAALLLMVKCQTTGAMPHA